MNTTNIRDNIGHLEGLKGVKVLWNDDGNSKEG